LEKPKFLSFFLSFKMSDLRLRLKTLFVSEIKAGLTYGRSDSNLEPLTPGQVQDYLVQYNTKIETTIDNFLDRVSLESDSPIEMDWVRDWLFDWFDPLNVD